MMHHTRRWLLAAARCRAGAASMQMPHLPGRSEMPSFLQRAAVSTKPLRKVGDARAMWSLSREKIAQKGGTQHKIQSDVIQKQIACCKIMCFSVGIGTAS
jgi:hypothetical protein